MIFVDSSEHTYSAASLLEDGAKPSSSTSPFTGKTAQECYVLLKHLCERTKSTLYPDIFAIFDERSLQDDTVLLVEADQESGEVESVRASFELACCRLMQYFAADAGAGEDREQAERTADGILRV